MFPVLTRGNGIVFVHILSPFFCDNAFGFEGCLNSFTCVGVALNLLYRASAN